MQMLYAAKATPLMLKLRKHVLSFPVFHICVQLLVEIQYYMCFKSHNHIATVIKTLCTNNLYVVFSGHGAVGG